MADPIEEKPKVEEQKEEIKGYDYAKDHGKSMRVLAKEEAEKAREAKKEELEARETEKPVKEEKPVEKKEPVTPPEKKEVEKPPINEDELAEKAATKAAEKLKADIGKIEESKALSEKEKEEKKEELKSKWQKEGRTPATYDEIYEEASEAGFEKAKKWFQDQRELEKKNYEEAQTQEKAAQDFRQKQEEEYRKGVEDMTMAEVQELEDEGVLQKIKDPNDPNDPALVERRDLFALGLKINTERQAQGKPPIISISRIYYNHFKASQAVKPKQPAGGDAPIAGARTTPTEKSSEKPYVYARDHNKSWRQIISDVRNRGKGS